MFQAKCQSHWFQKGINIINSIYFLMSDFFHSIVNDGIIEYKGRKRKRKKNKAF